MLMRRPVPVLCLSLNRELPPALVMALALALCGCSAVERLPVLPFADAAVKTASTASTGTSVESPGDIRPPDN